MSRSISPHGKAATWNRRMTSSSEFEPELLVNGPAQASRTIILAHGAGVAMDSEFMDTFSKGLAERDIRVVRFEFPYMSVRRKTGKRRPPDREPVLRETWLRVIESLGTDRVIGLYTSAGAPGVSNWKCLQASVDFTDGGKR